VGARLGKLRGTQQVYNFLDALHHERGRCGRRRDSGWQLGCPSQRRHGGRSGEGHLGSVIQALQISASSLKNVQAIWSEGWFGLQVLYLQMHADFA
jgi:hypothetical protein